MAVGPPPSNSGAPQPLKAPFEASQSRQNTSSANYRPGLPVQPASRNQQPYQQPYQQPHQRSSIPPRALADPFVSPRLGLSSLSSFIPQVPNNDRPAPGHHRPSTFHSYPVLAQRRPKWALPIPQRFLPSRIGDSRFVQYMRQRPNVRVHAFPFVEVFPVSLEPPRSAQDLAERILCLLNIKALLRCQRVSRHLNSTIRSSLNLQRRMWFMDTHHPVTRPDDPNEIDPIVLGLRHELDLLFDCTPGTNFRKILYAPSGQPITLQDTGISSWRRMAVMRSGERGKSWQLVIAGQGTIDLGQWLSPPTFGHVIDAIADVMVHGGRKYKLQRK